LGLKFGIYEAIAERTCAGYPGLAGHLELDANTLVKEWNVDYLKIDACTGNASYMAKGNANSRCRIKIIVHFDPILFLLFYL